MEGLPGFWRFAWMFLMQPVTLGRLVRGLGVDPWESGWKLLRRRRSAVDDWWLLRSAQLLLLSLITSVPQILWWWPVSGRALQIPMVGLVAVLLALTDIGSGVYAGITVVGLVALWVSWRWIGGLVVLLAAAVVVGANTTVLVGDTRFNWVASLLRVPLSPLELILEALARLWNTTTHRSSLAWTPVLYHELSPLPLPLLEGHILAEADANPALARRVLDACSIAPGQRRIGRRAEAKLRAQELARLARANDFQALAGLRGLWLPGIQGADPLLLSFSEAGRYSVAANAAFNPHHRLKHLGGFAAQLNGIENQLRWPDLVGGSALTQPFEEPLVALRDAGQALRIEAEKNAAGRIPNPFRVFEPLSAEAGPELFRGRERAVHEIEDALADAGSAVSLQLLAPRRAGKTSLLKMLPGMLPDTVCVFFDLQAHPVASVGAFWNKLAEQALIQAKLQRRTDLPPLPAGPPMEAARPRGSKSSTNSRTAAAYSSP
jgi:hypothetical protein